jgi:hypothetical protein
MVPADPHAHFSDFLTRRLALSGNSSSDRAFKLASLAIDTAHPDTVCAEVHLLSQAMAGALVADLDGRNYRGCHLHARWLASDAADAAHASSATRAESPPTDPRRRRP